MAEDNVIDLDWSKLLSDVIKKTFTGRGHINILVAGKTGVGKSTLINAMFQGNIANTGKGKPVTRAIQECTKQGLPISIYDTPGLELADYKALCADVINLVEKKRRDDDANKHIHVAWICLSEDSQRVEDGEIKLVEELKLLDVPVIVVITKARSDKEFRETVCNLLPKANAVVRVRAQAEKLDDGYEIKPGGMPELLEATASLVPEGILHALSAVQDVSLPFKVQRANVVVNSCALASGAAAPLAGGAGIAGVFAAQCAMLTGITLTFGLPASSSFIKSLIGVIVGGVGTIYLFSNIVKELAKLTPVWGAFVGAMDAVAAVAATRALGTVYIRVLKSLFDDRAEAETKELPTEEQIRAEFKKQWSLSLLQNHSYDLS